MQLWSTDSEHVGDLLPGPALIPGSAYLRRLELLKQPPEGSYRPQAGLWVAVRCRRGEFIDFTHACQLTLTGIAASIYVDEWVPAGEKVRTDRSTPVRRAGPSPLPGWRARWPSAPRSGPSRHTGMTRRLCSRPQRRACTVPVAAATQAGSRASTGGGAAWSTTPVGCWHRAAGWRCSPRPVRRTTRTFRAGRLSSVRAATLLRSFLIGGKERWSSACLLERGMS